MVRPLPTLSDEDIDDEDMTGMESQRQHDHWSHGSIGPPSSPAQDNTQEARWQFQADAVLHEFSSAQHNDEQLPETVPIPSQLEELGDGAGKSTNGRNYLDMSETCSTARRSSPCKGDDLDHPWDFVNEQSIPSDLSVSNSTGEHDSSIVEEVCASQAVEALPEKKSEEQQKRPYNTRSRANISYAPSEHASTQEDPRTLSSPNFASESRAKKPRRKVSPAKNNTTNSTRRTSPRHLKTTEQADNKSPQTLEKRKRRQRRKTPLAIDEETQTVQTTLPATPPVSAQRPMKRQRHQLKQALAKQQAKPPTRNKEQQIVSPAPARKVDHVQHGPDQPVQLPSSPDSENKRSMSLSSDAAPDINLHQNGQDDSSIADSIQSTEMTTPSTLPSLRRISSIQIPITSHQPLTSHSSPSVSHEIRQSNEAGAMMRPPLVRNLSTIVPRIVSRGEEDIGHRLQEIHKVGRVALYLQDKEKGVSSVASTYLRNGTRCVDRLQSRFSKERQILLQKMHDDNDTFSKSLNAAKRGIREGAKDRQRVLKELDRNAKKRQHSCSNEVGRIKDMAKRIQSEG
ncbi:hypothetical protein IF1G_10888 [Cordyceps javanica]|uniref:Uncharacterized protein n=1 Tax=Cordyceps javanica TaxID=43265 RepID=A0A545ULS1_9HYPO|nr:hypothetical protein IF1G_10888 [Cordyceps javanica]TQW01969.1 hypothetical protein IF2G_10540 [Cordyceps javanica]